MPTVKILAAMKGIKKITMLTAYEYSTAAMLDKCGIDAVLVGDSLGMVFQGRKDTIPVTVDEIIYHVKAVRRGVNCALVIADMPFMSYQASAREAKKNAGRIIKESGADAVKLEGGEEIIPQIKAINAMGVPVMGHIGLQPQSVKIYGGYPVQGKDKISAAQLIDSAKQLEKAGVFAIVLEKTVSETARALTAAVKVPVIGIGAGNATDGQVLVTQDMLGIFPDFKPKFVRKYADIGALSFKAVKAYIKDVKSGKFPSKKESF